MAVILIADDDADIREVLTLLLARAGHGVLSAVDGAAALQLAVTNKPDLVLADMDMPGLDGAQLCRELRNHRRLRTTPVAILSGTLHRDDPRVRDIGSCAVLLEPMSNRSLLTTVQRLITAGPHRHDLASGCLNPRAATQVVLSKRVGV
ncbi:response regulator [Actinoplanes sp. NPDC051859]|uniref:response regulator n=1 Tax=Actinoplanes sp. NPDC051859 TaxID=3363909 RepID=UPI0037B2F2EA